MKIIKYILLVIFAISAGSSAMEPVQVDLQRVQALKESFRLQGQELPDGIAINIVEYASAQERIVEYASAQEKIDRARIACEAGSEKAYILRTMGFSQVLVEDILEYANAQEIIDIKKLKDYNEACAIKKVEEERVKYWLLSLDLVSASIPLFAAARLVSVSGKYMIAGCGCNYLATVLLGKGESLRSCYGNRNILAGHILGLFWAPMISPFAPLLYTTGLAKIGFDQSKKIGLESDWAWCLLGLKLGSIPLIPLFAKRLFQDEGPPMLNTAMLAGATFAAYSGIGDVYCYNNIGPDRSKDFDEKISMKIKSLGPLFDFLETYLNY